MMALQRWCSTKRCTLHEEGAVSVPDRNGHLRRSRQAAGSLSRSRPARVSALLAWLVCLAWIAPLRAQVSVTCSAEEGERSLSCLVDASLLFDPSLRTILESGFTNNLVYRIHLLAPDRPQPLAIAVAAFAEVFRLYTDVYYVSREGTPGYTTHTDWEGAVRDLSRFPVHFPFERPDEPRIFLVAVMLEVNPVSPAHLAEARSWIAQSGGTFRLLGGEEQTFFATLLSLILDSRHRTAEQLRTGLSPPFEVAP
ncbi:MAG: hypothetical protein JW797_12100 [Bradymonadales bacterium]|nr:hypothetical protein [Bradymonadales bacterium]